MEIGNIYPKEYARMAYEGMEAEGQENIVNLLRCAWAGSQKYGALVWSGDIDSSFRSLRNQLVAGLNMGIADYLGGLQILEVFMEEIFMILNFMRF